MKPLKKLKSQYLYICFNLILKSTVTVDIYSRQTH